MEMVGHLLCFIAILTGDSYDLGDRDRNSVLVLLLAATPDMLQGVLL